MAKAKKPLWQVLIDRDNFSSKEEAESWILMGKVYVNGDPVSKSGAPIDASANIFVKDAEQRYVGRGGEKLEGALNHFDINLNNWVVLDAGASTGGFSDCLVQKGANRVYAVDAGYGQLAGKLRADPRVVNREKTNIGALRRADLRPSPTFATIDLSYLSLQKAIPLIYDLLEWPKAILSLVKPLFEVNSREIRRTGIIVEDAVYGEVLEGLVQYCRGQKIIVHGVCHSPVTGNKGTLEFFLLTSSDANFRQVPSAADISTQIVLSIAEAKVLKHYQQKGEIHDQ